MGISQLLVSITRRCWVNYEPLLTEHCVVAGTQRKDDSSSWQTMSSIVLPVVISITIIICLIVVVAVWRFRRHCCRRSSDPEEPNTDNKCADACGRDNDDPKRCRASTSNNTNTPEIIINFVPSRPSQKNVNNEQARRTWKQKEMELSSTDHQR